MSAPPRRSARLAQKADPTPAPPPSPVSRPKKAPCERSITSPPLRPSRALTEEEIAHDRTVREQLLLIEARNIAQEIRIAETIADFYNAEMRADALFSLARGLIWREMDEFFITDCMLDLQRGPEHRTNALQSIRVYIDCLEQRIADPPRTILVYP